MFYVHLLVGFSDNDLIQIKIQGYKKEQNYYYETLLAAKEKNEEMSLKIEKFLSLLQSFRNKKEYLSLDEFIWQVYLETGYYNYVSLMPNGTIRQANLKMLFEKAKEYESASFKGLFNFINFIDKLRINNQDMDSAKNIGENEDVIRIMSIHKSKGLEFPVVFLCSTGKKFNFQDLNDSIILHQDIGFGPQYIDYKRRIQYNTLAKVAIGYKSKNETISEEMRILYVALTRAKEKLIITGMSKDLEKDMKKKKDLLDMCKTKTISPNILKNYKSYLDWMELVYLKNKDIIQNVMELNTYTKEDLIKKLHKGKKEKEILSIKDIIKQEKDEIGNTYQNVRKTKNEYKKISQINKTSNNEEENLKELLDWKYKNINCINKIAKTSVTKIKEMQNVISSNNEKVNGIEKVRENKTKKEKQQNIEKTLQQAKYKTEDLQTPKFLKENLKITNAQIGTLMHLCIQKMDEKQEYTKEKLENEIQKLVQNEIITRE